ncbi:hypothetical protein [Alistipes finegoldii]|uniref:hypothetical protein n=2 Tax=Rikenellaceae TaxID=171550 RepID=UPI00242B09C4|nr:hypothetical protein [Alistipes finegoldii]
MAERSNNVCEDLNGHLNDKNTIPDRRHDSLSYTRPPMAEIAAQTAFGTNLTYTCRHQKASEIWPFLAVFGGDVTSGVKRRVQILFECNTKVTLK